MIVAFYIFLALVVVGGFLYIQHNKQLAKQEDSPSSEETASDSKASSSDNNEVCCGMHITCEKDSLLASVSPEIEYYDDEELDAYRGRSAHDYNEEETEQFRDVLLTLLPQDIAGWGRSLQLRGINLPAPVREELLLIVAEERLKHATQ